MSKRKVELIIIHCSATTPGMDIGAAEIKRWHTDPNKPGGPYSDIGYHGIIRRDGTLESGRSLEEAGAHCKGKNARSVGICLAGGICGGATCEHEHETFGSGQRGKPENNYTPAQWATLERVVRDLLRKYPGARVAGHNEFAARACPCFKVPEWWAKVSA